jgi:two-component system, chemotaxis family, sensor kinase CheA
MADPYRYFRIEARELIDELIAGLTGLGHGESATGRVGALLRHTHTLKGAARVVGQTAIADHTHALEGLLEPFRGSIDPVPADQVEEMLGRVDDIADLVRGLDIPAAVPAAPTVPECRPEPGPGPAGTVPAAVPAPRIELPTDVQPDHLRTARTSLAEIDAVITGVGQSRNQLSVLRECLALSARTAARTDLDPNLREALDAVQRELGTCADRMDRDLRSVYDVAERLRLVPVTSIVPDLEGAARDVAVAQGKRVRLEVGGAQLRLDAPVLEAVQGALRQIVRNAVAHGIESSADRVAAGKPAGGRIRLEVRQSGGQVVFSCSDDGRGIDIDAVRRELGQGGPGQDRLDDDQVLDRLALGGVSTAAVVSEVSGRGIGLDVVRDAAVRLGGRVAIRTRSGVGTTIDLTTQLSLSAQEVLVVDDGALMAVPLAAVRETARVAAGEITTGLSGEILHYCGDEIPFLPLAAALGDNTCTGASQPAWSVLIVTGASGPVAIGTRRLVGTATIAIRPLPPIASVSPLVSGIWVDVDAHARLVLDPQLLAAAATVRRSITVPVPVPPAPILIVDDSLTTRMLEQSVLEAAGYRVELAASAEEGLALAARKPYALVLVDVEMPGMDGFAFVEQTRSRPELRHLPCILVTSRASAQDRQRGLAAGARAHIDKREFHQGTLLSRIAELLGG